MPSAQVFSSLVIGTGISGLFTALKLAAADIPVLLLTKAGLADNNSRYAQGGIAAVLPESLDDSLELHLQDTLRAGAGLCNEAMARSILSEGFLAIEDLLAFGVPFDRTAENRLALTQEAAHSRRRILHAGGDATGQSVEMTLIEKVRENPLIQVIENCLVTDLLVEDGVCQGVEAMTLADEKVWRFLAPHTILATGGIGQLYAPHTTNPAIATGDGIALAERIGAAVHDLEFVQFHPTAFYALGKVQFLVSEALRGEGGLLKNSKGERFALKHHPDGEMAPRDIVTRAIYAELQATGEPCVYLDITHLPVTVIEERFPTILASCLQFGIDIREQPIPVSPAAHYMMGGVVVDSQGKSSVEGLYVVGEAAYTGLHGANRLASNSLLECVVLARRVAEAIATTASLHPTVKPSEVGNQWAEARQAERVYYFEENALLEKRLESLHHYLWTHVGIVRTEEGLQTAQTIIEEMTQEVTTHQWQRWVPQGLELMNQLRVAGLITNAAMARKKSCGAHFRTDLPLPALY